jgi:hypothetical protein
MFYLLFCTASTQNNTNRHQKLVFFCFFFNQKIHMNYFPTQSSYVFLLKAVYMAFQRKTESINSIQCLSFDFEFIRCNSIEGKFMCRCFWQ